MNSMNTMVDRLASSGLVATFVFENVEFSPDLSHPIRVELDQEWAINIAGTGNRLRWFADNDPVLSIAVTADGFAAQLKATALGKSRIELQHQRNIVMVLEIEVMEAQDKTVSVGMTFTNIRPIQK
jgi:hypothetical protein